MKTAIEKPVTPGGVFDHLMVPQGDEPEFHPSKDPKTMTVQESLEEVDRFLCWNRMTPEEKRAEQEAQRAASHATEQAAGDIPCTMRPERMPDTPQDTVWEDLTDAPQDVVRADVLDTSMGGMLEAVPSNGAPERAADTMPDDVPDATEGNVPGREADTVPDGPPDDLPDTVEGNMPDVVGALTAQEKAGNETVQGVPEVEVVPPEAIVPLGQTGEDAPAAEERWAYASELIGDAFQHWGNGRVLLDMGTGRGKSEFVIRKMAGWAVDQFLEGNCDNRILMLCPLTLLHEDLENRRREEYLTVFGDASEEEWDLYEEVLTVITYQKLEQLCKGDASDHRSLQKLLDRHRIIIADECHYWSEFSAFNINTHYSFDTLLQAEKNHTVIYMSATGRDTWKLLEEKGGPTQLERIYRLPQHYEYVKAAYFYARHNLVTILKRLPVGEKAIVFVELGDDLAEMETIFGDTAAYYCSPFNERYRKKYSDLSVCIKDGQQLKDILFTTKAMGVGIGLKDRGVKHIFIDQWNPLEIAQSLGRKRSLDADDTCTVYFRDYSLDWYWGTNSGLKKFRSMLLNKYLPAQAYMAGEEEFDKYLHSDNPEVIQKKIDKSKILEHNVVTGYHINPLGLQQVEHDIEILSLAVRNDSNETDTSIRISIHIENESAECVQPDRNLINPEICGEGECVGLEGIVYDEKLVEHFLKMNEDSYIRYEENAFYVPFDPTQLRMPIITPFGSQQEDSGAEDYEKELKVYIKKPEDDNGYQYEIGSLRANETIWMGPVMVLKKRNAEEKVKLKYSIISNRTNGDLEGKIEVES